jgi:hypothetical protein
VPCKKYFHTVDNLSKIKNRPDHYKAVLKLSADGKKLLIENMVPMDNKTSF